MADDHDIRSLFSKAGLFMEELMRENQELRRQLGKVEAENQEFADRYVQIEQHNEILQNLYVASHRLHGTLEPSAVLDTIKEIVINLVGSESFGIWMFDKGESGQMSLLGHEGLDDSAALSPVEMERFLGLTDGTAWFRGPEDDDTADALAIVPLQCDGRTVGLIAIRKLLGHKKKLAPLDRQILELLSGQAATALTSARLYSEKVRKLETMRAFVDFIKTKG